MLCLAPEVRTENVHPQVGRATPPAGAQTRPTQPILWDPLGLGYTKRTSLNIRDYSDLSAFFITFV